MISVAMFSLVRLYFGAALNRNMVAFRLTFLPEQWQVAMRPQRWALR
jgi:hypothetical protein